MAIAQWWPACVHKVNIWPFSHDIAIEGIENALVSQLKRIEQNLLVLAAEGVCVCVCVCERERERERERREKCTCPLLSKHSRSLMCSMYMYVYTCDYSNSVDRPFDFSGVSLLFGCFQLLPPYLKSVAELNLPLPLSPLFSLPRPLSLSPFLPRSFPPSQSIIISPLAVL